MSNRSQITKAVQKARRSMLFEYFFKYSQRMLASVLLLPFSIILLSRFFVLPFYQEITFGIAAITLFISAIYLWVKRPTNKQSLEALDAYFPDNLLRTVYSMEEYTSPLAKQLLIWTEKKAANAIAEYKKRKKNLWFIKHIIASTVLLLGLALLSLFPSSSQQNANNIKEEKLMTAEVQKAVKDMKKKAITNEMKKAMEELQKDLKTSKTTEEALQELVKKQKELTLQKQKIEEKNISQGINKEEQKQLKGLKQATASLSKQSLQTQKALRQSGTSVSPNLQLALNQSSQSNSSSTQNNNPTSQGNLNSIVNGNQSAAQSTSPSSTPSNNQNSTQNQSSQNQNLGNSSGIGNSNGNQNGSGNLKGNSGGNSGRNGTGTGPGIGSGAGSRDLVAVPKRIGEKGKTTTDQGKLNNGDPTNIQESNNGKITKGSVRSYKEITGNYKNSYMQTTERLQLPGELHQIVQEYFSSLEK